MFELYYSDGGHGGPYKDLYAARDAALRLYKGSRSIHTIEMRPSWSNARGGFSSLNYPESIYLGPCVRINSEDIGDEDCAKRIQEVWTADGNLCLASFNTIEGAITFVRYHRLQWI
jgi:hypothetical protein